MCGFSQLSYTECGHEFVSTTAQHTQLCDYAKMFHLMQGIDCAPAACVPTSNTETLIVAKHDIFGYCEDCRAIVEVRRGEDEHIRQIHAHVKPETVGEYDQQDMDELKDLNKYIEETMMTGMQIAESFECFLVTELGSLQYLADPELRILLSKPDQDKYNELYLTALIECRTWLPVLEAHIQQRAPRKLFADTMLFVFHKAEKVSQIIYQFRDLAMCLYDYESSSEQQKFNGSEAQLELFEKILLRLRTGTPDSPPAGFYLYDEKFQISFNTRLTFQIRNALRQTYINKPIPRAGQMCSRSEQGVMNKKGLTVEVFEGLLPDEPAIDIQIEHIPITDERNVEVLDEENDTNYDGERLLDNMSVSNEAEETDRTEEPEIARITNELPTAVPQTRHQPIDQTLAFKSLPLPLTSLPLPDSPLSGPPTSLSTAHPPAPQQPPIQSTFTHRHRRAVSAPQKRTVTASFTSLHVSSPPYRETSSDDESWGRPHGQKRKREPQSVMGQVFGFEDEEDEGGRGRRQGRRVRRAEGGEEAMEL
ncbi:Nn.00g003220.m01.CDS01 [Neocucurbitaria sp. VM-36]